MGAIRKTPKWLKKIDQKETGWAAEYLLNRWPKGLNPRPSSWVPIAANLDETIRTLEVDAGGVKLIERLRNAIRQRRYRLAGGGRVTCSFTLPILTRDKLKALAAKDGTTETAILEAMINEAQQASEDQKEEERREALNKKVTRNSDKLAQELIKIRLEATTKHLDACLKKLAGWQVYLNEQSPELSPEQESEANRIAEKRMREIQEAIRAAVAKHEMMSPRNI
ncbi:hypothetical protein [Aquipseudomonas alcaligenes]|jgi:hypothetical protein|uniref:Uncharacterized protein n=4 Tax=Pseudomonadaceae TaxID=135621 RepID=A0AA37CHX6_AQUAC|nr:hypothetical protein [Pseudomonas alcaligenes]ATR84933.1 hypothetical protein CS390_21645 [Pseudomonas sp. HLS-6]MPT19107.1 hypothetical protein [Pseudomonas sp.]MWK56279.1 hypothetical protein [Pseudomonas otitidis]QQN52585.1 hypothetical protein I6H70_09290 [Stutzerimonas balearica]BCR26454.1 hypothetical protein KAM426_39810 [Pseudomonas alcaligenes]